MPNHLLSGGLTGIGIIVYFMTGGLPVGAQVLVGQMSADGIIQFREGGHAKRGVPRSIAFFE